MSDIVKFLKDEIIFNEGAFEEYMYEVIDGAVGIYSDYNGDGKKLLTEVKQGSFFGEMGVLEDAPRSATAVAITDCTVRPYFANELEDYIKLRPEKTLELMQSISSRIRNLTKDYVSACSAISEYVKAEEENTPKSEELMNKMRAIAEVGNKKKK